MKTWYWFALAVLIVLCGCVTESPHEVRCEQLHMVLEYDMIIRNNADLIEEVDTIIKECGQ